MLDGHEGSKSAFDSHSIENYKLDAFIQMCIHTGFRVRSFFLCCTRLSVSKPETCIQGSFRAATAIL